MGESETKTLPLDALHRELGAKMVPFAGYAMAVQYPMGVMQEHLWTREKAGLFDVSHMGQIVLTGAPWEDIALAMETILPQSVLALAQGRQRYGYLTNADGGIEDDLMFARIGDALHIVVNGACKYNDIKLIRAAAEGVCSVDFQDEKPLLALQGPAAERVLSAIVPEVAAMKFMDARACASAFGPLLVTRSGYTGEDGFEISVAADQAEGFARALLADAAVAPIGLGARDSLRLEAGMPLYGNDITCDTSPVEADLAWGIQKVRRTGNDRAGGFPGDARILAELTSGPARRRSGLKPEGRAPMRGGVDLYETQTAQNPIGQVTSGGFGPSVGGPVAMGYVPAETQAGTTLYGDVRGKRMPVTVSDLPFHTPRYKR